MSAILVVVVTLMPAEPLAFSNAACVGLRLSLPPGCLPVLRAFTCLQPVSGRAAWPRAGSKGGRRLCAGHLPGCSHDAPADRAAGSAPLASQASASAVGAGPGPHAGRRGVRQRAQHAAQRQPRCAQRGGLRLAAVDAAAGGDCGCHAGGAGGAHLTLPSRKRECGSCCLAACWLLASLWHSST